MSHPSLDLVDIKAVIERRLFVCRLPPGADEEVISAHFSRFGTLDECKLLVGKGIAFVGYPTWAEAHHALLETDGQALGNFSCKLQVKFAEHTPFGRSRGGDSVYSKGLEISRIFVGTLPEDTTTSELSDFFSRVGHVEVAKLLPAKYGKRHLCGYVTYQIWGEAMDAVELFHGQPMRRGEEGMTVLLASPNRSAQDAGQRQNETLERPFPPLKRRRPAWEVAEADFDVCLTSYLEAVRGDSSRYTCDELHDQLMEAREFRLEGWQEMSRGPRPKRSRSVQGAPWRNNNESYGWGSRREAATGHADERRERDWQRIFIKGLPPACRDEDLRALALQLRLSCGPEASRLLECRVLRGRGCGYLRYTSTKAAEEALAVLDGRRVEGWKEGLHAEYAQCALQKTSDTTAETLAVDRLEPPDPMSEASLDSVEAAGLEANRLFVGQIPRGGPELGPSLQALFERFGPLREFRLMTGKGVLYVTYDTFEEARQAMRTLSRACVPGVSKALNVQFSQHRPAV